MSQKNTTKKLLGIYPNSFELIQQVINYLIEHVTNYKTSDRKLLIL